MAYSKQLADRVRRQLSAETHVAEKKMFGGVGFLLHGNMLVGIWQASLIARLGEQQAAAALAQPHVRPFDVTGRPMKGWVLIEPEGLDGDTELAAWLDRARTFVTTLPAK